MRWFFTVHCFTCHDMAPWTTYGEAFGAAVKNHEAKWLLVEAISSSSLRHK